MITGSLLQFTFYCSSIKGKPPGLGILETVPFTFYCSSIKGEQITIDEGPGY